MVTQRVNANLFQPAAAPAAAAWSGLAFDRLHPWFGQASAPGPAAAIPCALSSVQIRPRVPNLAWAIGGKWAKLQIPAPPEPGKIIGGKRGAITDFSWRSHRGLLRWVNQINRDVVGAEQVTFVTLSYPGRGHAIRTPQQAKADLKKLLQRFQRAYGRRPVMWKLEPQKRGAPHFHLLAFGGAAAELQGLQQWWAREWHDLVGESSADHLAVHLGTARDTKPCCEQIRSWAGVGSYAAKYLGKIIDGTAWVRPGRWWGIHCREELPIAKGQAELELTEAHELRRGMRRFLEHQGTGRWRVKFEGKTYRGWMDRAGLDSWRRLGADVRPIRRKVKLRQGGLEAFITPAGLELLKASAMKNARRKVGQAIERRNEDRAKLMDRITGRRAARAAAAEERLRLRWHVVASVQEARMQEESQRDEAWAEWVAHKQQLE